MHALSLLTPNQIALARVLWAKGDDTTTIAKKLWVAEHIVYNGRAYFTKTKPRSLAGTNFVSPFAHESSPRSVPRTLGRSSTSCLTESQVYLINEAMAKL